MLNAYDRSWLSRLVLGAWWIAAAAQPADKQPRAPGFILGRDPMRGVNIGGWLVLEPWITPTLFEGKPAWVVDEWTYGQYMRSQNDSMSEIRKHWSNWFSFSELEDIAGVGLNTIRIPIGFWSLIPLENGEPYLVGAYPFLKMAVEWAQILNLKVMIDLHGVPGSQNGFDNSGLRTTRQWFANQTNFDRTLRSLSVLTTDFTVNEYNGTVIAIELVNEPFPQSDDDATFLRSFYQEAYGVVRASSQDSSLTVALDSAFQGLSAWENFMVLPNYYDVAMDTHIYSMFDLSLISQGYTANLDWICGQQTSLTVSNQYHWTIVGEWTVAHTDCARWLNGRGLGARYDNSLVTSGPLGFPGDCKTKTGADASRFSAEYADYLARSFETQTWVYEKAVVWLDNVDLEDRGGLRVVDANRYYLRLDTDPYYSKAAWNALCEYAYAFISSAPRCVLGVRVFYCHFTVRVGVLAIAQILGI